MTTGRISLRNFKCFEALDLPCAPLTLLTGRNAGGKSTALQALLLLVQGLREAPNNNLLPLNGALVSLGTGGDVVYHSASAQKLCLGVSNSAEQAIWDFRVDKGLSMRGLMTLADIEYSRDGNSVGISNHQMLPSEMETSDLIYSLRDTTFISAGREMQLESYPVPQSPAHMRGDVGCSGEYAPYWYLEFADEAVMPKRRHPKDQRETVRAQVDAWFSEFFPGARANAERLSADAPIRLSFSLGQASPWSKPANVGYGLSYAFPMLVTLLTAKAGSTVVIDSAESHLHPKAQSAVGYFIAKVAGSGLQILVESHSDHLLNGVRLAVRDGLLEPNDAAIHFFEHPSQGLSVTTVSVDGNGAISDWPEGFFDQTERDLATLSGWC
ncbi:MAG: DUF3696 domain-containing protein [Gammaproteobacteria bacterium]|nr:DUF3696 domain-containing protein [Gammaproteobacteria bacterium]